jgi:uncharacterized protein (DUF1778 family)
MLRPKRSDQLAIRVTPDERKALEKAASKHGSGSVSEYVREAALKYDRLVNPQTDYKGQHDSRGLAG